MRSKYFNGKNAVITGAASGIGREFANVLAKMGTNLVISDINEERLEETKREIESVSSVKVVSQICDVTKPLQLKRLAKTSIKEMVNIHFLFSNAGIALGGPFEHLLIAQWERIININVWGMIHTVRAFIPKMLEQGFGHVIVTASIAGTFGVGGLNPYNTSKFANAGFCESLYSEYSSKGINVSAICPFPLNTNLLETVGIGIPPALLASIDPEILKVGIEAGKLHYWEEFTKKQSIFKGFGGGFAVDRSVKRYINKIRKKRLYIFERRYGRFLQFMQGLWPGFYRFFLRKTGKNHLKLIQETYDIALKAKEKVNKLGINAKEEK